MLLSLSLVRLLHHSPHQAITIKPAAADIQQHRIRVCGFGQGAVDSEGSMARQIVSHANRKLTRLTA
jgi:hypothetical protein